jgi:hypothetical protein
MKPMELIFIGAMIVVIGGVVTAIGTLKQNKSSSAKSDKQLAKIEELNQQNVNLSTNLSELSTKNSTLALQLGKVSEQNSLLISEVSDAKSEVIKAKQEAFDNTFGSNEVIFVPGASNHGKFFNQSMLPAYDLRIFVTDFDKLLTCAKATRDKFGQILVNRSCYEASTKRFTVGVLYGQSVFDALDAEAPSDKSYRRVIKFMTRKGTYYQQFINVVPLGTAYRILGPINETEHMKQFMQASEDIKEIKKLEFKLIEEHSTFLKAVDWEKEFPLPVSFNVVN